MLPPDRFLLENDGDDFNRWEAAQTIARGLLEDTYKNGGVGNEQALTSFATALGYAISLFLGEIFETGRHLL